MHVEGSTVLVTGANRGIGRALVSAFLARGGYPASKAALHLMTQAVRADLGPRGIAVHAVFPGPVDTDMFAYAARCEPSFGEFPLASAAEVAAATIDGLEAGEEDIFPDAFAARAGREWRADPKALERRLTDV
ncbi:SDR family NAD(P)-dependent oxidoreductase [Streptomyces roseoverticillatus]|uniref:SDR family NAD(P)-dependent oxidoreductase n=1 Tax=Streptomyces roseoverticillatus TaxID=66429 RepID=UPI001F2D22AB|nr:SDR family NAD(P)-dependent oxidoreductase [Streptomyces roseoverticillatus]MCF3104358.1 SDR family NAD(P)-dependent oxidoreductase [Streptomyces roseoverticillatus]